MRAQTPNDADSTGVIEQFLDEILPNRLLQVLAIVAAAFVVAKVVNWILCNVIRTWARRTKIQLDEQIVNLLQGPVVKSVVILGIGIAAELLDTSERVSTVTNRALWTIVLAIWTVFAFRLNQLLLRAAAAQPDRFLTVESRTYPLFDNLGKLLIIGLATYLLIETWSVDPTGWIASAGLIGIAVGFAAKDTLANFFSGIFIIADAPYKVGDFINLQDGTRGQVVYIGLRSTRLLTRDDIEITIPNAIIGNSQITNETGGRWSKSRIRVKVGVAYGSDVDLVRRVLLEAAEIGEHLATDPEPRVRFRRFGDSALEFELLGWITEPVLRGRVTDALNTEVYKRFADEGIEIAYPKRDIYIREMPRGDVSGTGG